MFPLRYGLNFYILLRRNSVFKGLTRAPGDSTDIIHEAKKFEIFQGTEKRNIVSNMGQTHDACGSVIMMDIVILRNIDTHYFSVSWTKSSR
jgi:hypothetical protein